MSVIVPAEGPKEASIMLVGEAPGEMEVRDGRPFVGGAGKVLNGMLAEAGIDRELCYITNVMQTRPPANNFGHFYEDKGRVAPKPELLQGISRLISEIQTVQPKVIIAFGNEPLKILTEKNGITHWRGSVLPVDKLGLVLPTYHPAAVMRQWNWRPITVFDLQRAKKISENGGWTPPAQQLVINPKFDEVMAFLEGATFGAERTPTPRLAFDIEIETQQIQAIAFSHMPGYAMCIPFWFGASGSYWSEKQEVEIWEAIRKLFANPKIGFIAQNAQFDMTFMRHQFGIVPANLYMDTMIAHHTLYPELPKGLDFQCSMYTDQPFYKDMINTKDPDEFWRYNALDACITFECAVEIEKEMREVGLWDFYEKEVNPLIWPLCEMGWKGVKIDKVRRRKLTKEYKEKLINLQEQLNTQVGHDLNPNSPKQMQEYLYKELGLPKQTRYRKTSKKGPGETVTADETAIRTILKKQEIAPLRTVLEMRATRKILSTYLQAEIDPDGRMRTSYIIAGTETGRLASRESALGTGTNLQNIPHGVVRSLFIPDEGMTFVSGDLSQAEARVVAYLAQEPCMIEVFERQGGDIHKQMGAIIFGKPAEEITPDERQLAKRAVHASNYGIGPRKFAQIAEIKEKEAKALLGQYFTAFPKVKIWQLEIESQLKKTRTLRTPIGRVRQFLASWNDELVREAFAYIPQSTVSDLLNKGLLSFWRAQIPDVDMLLQVHDSVIVQCPSAKVDEVSAELSKHLAQSVMIHGAECRIPVEIKTGQSWEDL